jgi:hypothetical protein
MRLYFCVQAILSRATRHPVSYLLLKYVHILGAIVLLGTGGGIAFFMLMAP